MLVGHVFDFALILRSRRRDLRLRQTDLAEKAGVSRGFIIDLEHGKETVELGKVLRVLDVMAVPMSLGWNESPPDWAKPHIKRAQARERGWAETRPRSWRQKLRPAPKPPQSWHDAGAAGLAAIEAAEREAEPPGYWTKREVDRFVSDLSAARRRIVRAIAGLAVNVRQAIVPQFELRLNQASASSSAGAGLYRTSQPGRLFL